MGGGGEMNDYDIQLRLTKTKHMLQPDMTAIFCDSLKIFFLQELISFLFPFFQKRK